MPRPPRADEAGGLYHALNRGNLRANIFHKELDFAAFERILHEALQIHEVELFSFQLMPNHYHLVLRPLVDGEMSRVMAWIGGTHTMRYHAHYHTGGMGHAYQQRYKSFPIQDDDHFFVVCRYVERNALRVGLVERAEQWRWGSLWRWVRKPEPEPPLLSPWPMPRLPGWFERVNEPLSEEELAAVRLSAQRGRDRTFNKWHNSAFFVPAGVPRRTIICASKRLAVPRPLGDEGWVESIARRLNLESTMRPRGTKRVRFPKEDTKEA